MYIYIYNMYIYIIVHHAPKCMGAWVHGLPWGIGNNWESTLSVFLTIIYIYIYICMDISIYCLYKK